MYLIRTRRHLAIIALILLAASSSARAKPSPAAGDFTGSVEVDGRKLHVECKGTGAPIVILISGYRNDAEIWTTPPDAGLTPVLTPSPDSPGCAPMTGPAPSSMRPM